LEQTQDSGPRPIVELVNIRKEFPGVVANDDITLSFRGGEVHCLLGENGAGKSTLMSILSGTYKPDAGNVFVAGTRVTIDSPRRAIELGIGMVHQHVALAQALTVLENLMLGANEGIRLNEAKAEARLHELAGSLGVEIDPRAPAGTLALGQQQQVEIIKALWRDPRVLILDEPTSMLTPKGVDELAKVLAKLKQQGFAVIFITHKLHEALSMGDRVSFLRQGRVVGHLGPEDLRAHGQEELRSIIVRSMFGEEASIAAREPEMQTDIDGHEPQRDRVARSPLLEIIGVSVEADKSELGANDLDLSVGVGEIVGIAGVDGNGQKALAEAVAGQRPISAGDIRLAGKSVVKISVSGRERLGLRYVTDDGWGEGVVPLMSVGQNLVLKRIGQAPYWKGGRIRSHEIDVAGEALIEEFDIRTPSVRARAGILSGGNLRKLILARELSQQPRIVVFNKPTYGLDVKTTHAVRQRIREKAAAGIGALIISTDLEELIDLCDRIAVLLRGRITGIVENRPGRRMEEEIGNLMVGGATP
jgi:ABC-type uncharacterized transport system ATPase subunit